MTIQDKKQLVKEAIIRAVPSVMDLKMGCEVQYKWDDKPKYIVVGTFEVSEKNTPTQVECREIDGRKYDTVLSVDTLEIIGRPIQLQDVLIAIDKVDSDCCLSFEGQFVEYDAENGNMNLSGIWWKLSEDFDHQSEAFYLFAWELFCE